MVVPLLAAAAVAVAAVGVDAVVVGAAALVVVVVMALTDDPIKEQELLSRPAARWPWWLLAKILVMSTRI